MRTTPIDGAMALSAQPRPKVRAEALIGSRSPRRSVTSALAAPRTIEPIW